MNDDYIDCEITETDYNRISPRTNTTLSTSVTTTIKSAGTPRSGRFVTCDEVSPALLIVVLIVIIISMLMVV